MHENAYRKLLENKHTNENICNSKIPNNILNGFLKSRKLCINV